MQASQQVSAQDARTQVSFPVIGGAPGVMNPGNYVRNFPRTLASYLAGVKAAMLRPPALRTILLLLLALPFSFVNVAHAAADQQLPANWVPQGFEALGQRAAFHTDFTFDRAMLQVAGYFIGDGDQGTRNAIAKLNSISVHSYHFAGPGLYDPATLDLIRRQYEAAGWRHLVAVHGKGDPFNAGQTDLWINFAHMDVTGMMVLISGSKDLNLVSLNGDLSTVDLLHLRGHFGIPRFSGDRFVPSPSPGPGAAARQPYVSPAPAPQAGPDPYPGSVGVGVGADEPAVEPAPPPPTPPGF
jgi:hypothetical protein